VDARAVALGRCVGGRHRSSSMGQRLSPLSYVLPSEQPGSVVHSGTRHWQTADPSG
jgi:hypothetical protein